MKGIDIMRFFRNAEIKRLAAILTAITAFGTAAASFLSPEFGIIAFVCMVLIAAAVLFFFNQRYKKIASLSADIDNLLHNNASIPFERYAEGELSILENELYKMIERLNEQQSQLTKDKLFLADFIADISHQVRTPLTSINILLSFLSEPEITQERRFEIANELFELISRIEWLINTLLKISKLDAGAILLKSENCTAEKLIKESCEPVLIPAELREIKLETEFSGNFCGDISWTAEAISNIIKNCIEHTQKGGTVKIKATDTPLFFEIIISDNGSGIDETDLPHIFDRFYKGKNSDSNSVGIGLALARMIITLQNGTVKAANSDGAQFTIRLYKSTV